ncbi:MAG: hypothetical protein KBT69_15745 [Oceanihabitans sp.]|nr:hypothetical protein [Oceanihabitans sp.]
MAYFLKASAIAALFYLCYKLFLQRETFFESNRWFLLIGLLATICLPGLIIPLYIENPNTTLAISSITENTNLTATANKDYNLIVLSSIYLLGFSFFFFKLILEFVSLFDLLRENKSYKHNGLVYIETEKAISPFSFFRFIVYNPKQFCTTELEHIINHEKVHAKQFHSIDILFIQLATVVFWFNPFIWFYKKEVQQNLEFIADKNAQRISTNKKSYAYVLLKTSIANQPLALTNNFYSSLIKKRIVMLHKSKSRKRNALKYVLVLPLLTFFLMSFNTKEVYLHASTSNLTQTIGAIETVIINKDFSDAALEAVKTKFKTKDVTLDFKNIQRNDRNEIIAIKMEASSKKMKTNFSSNSNNAIKPIKITYNNKDYSISIHSIEANEITITEDNTTTIVPSESDSTIINLLEEEQNANVEVITEDSNNKDNKVIVHRKATTIDLNTEASENKEKVKFTTKDKDGNVVTEEITQGKNREQTWVVEEGGANDIPVFKTKTKDNKLFISTDAENSPLIFIDNKEATREELEKLDPNTIESMHVFKGEKLTRIYGEKAKNGVIQVTTKK